MADSNPIISLQNNSNAILKVNFAGGYQNTADNSNAVTNYTYNVTAVGYIPNTTVSIQAKTNPTAQFQTYQTPLLGYNAEGLVASLNALPFGGWYTYQSGGNTFVATYNDNIIFGDINIFDPNPATVLVTGDSTTVQFGSQITILLDLALQWNWCCAPGSTSFNATSGQTIEVDTFADVAEACILTINYQATPLAPIQNLLTRNIAPGGSDIYTFPVLKYYTYGIIYAPA